MIRLTIVAPHFPEYALRYANAMARHCKVLVVVDDAQLAAEFEGRAIVPYDGVTLQRLRFKTPLDLWRMSAIVRAFRPDFVHFQEAVGARRIFFTAAIVASMKRHSTLVLTVHDPVPHAGRDQAAARRFAWLSAFIRRSADVLVVHGAYCANALRGTVNFDRQHLVISDHGVILEPANFEPAPAVPPVKLYTFGRMETYKGIEVLLGMADILHEEGLAFELTIAGRGPELERLKDRFGQLPEVRVHNGFVSPNDVSASIQAAECVVLPYLSATQSGVLAAAYAGHRYVIASDTGGIPDVVTHGQNGLLVPPGNAAALADAVRTILHDPVLRAQLRAGAQATARERLDWDHIADAVFMALMDLPSRVKRRAVGAEVP